MNHGNHGTISETQWIDKMEWYLKGKACEVDRAELLRRYVKAIKRRRKWDSIDPKRIMEYAIESLERAEGG